MNENRSLTVKEYDAAEQEAALELPNTKMEACQPELFYKHGYPTRIRYESELWKYIDVMHSLRFEGDFADFIGGLTENEFELLKKLTGLILRFSESSFQKRMIARASVLRMINIFRHIKYLFGDARPRIFEIGPGCGYLGAMLLSEGYPYAATDVAQAFYLYQNHFWNFMTDGKVVELARDNSEENILDVEPGSIRHIPWWRFIDLEPESVPEYDIVTANHVLCEMHPDSLAFTLAIARSLLRGNKTPKVFMFEGWGAEDIRNKGAIAEEFYRFGFRIVHNDRRVAVFVPDDTEGMPDCLSLPRRYKGYYLRRLFNKSAGLVWPALVLPYSTYIPGEYSSMDNPLSRSILSGREAQQKAKTVDIEQVNDFYFDLLGSKDFLSPDEKFWILTKRRSF